MFLSHSTWNLFRSKRKSELVIFSQNVFLSLFHTHTHTHSLSLSLSFSLSLAFFLFAFFLHQKIELKNNQNIEKQKSYQLLFCIWQYLFEKRGKRNKMAAIIARITREKRDRDLRLLKEIKSSKSNSLSQPHPKSFIPEIHNKGRRSNQRLCFGA